MKKLFLIAVGAASLLAADLAAAQTPPGYAPGGSAGEDGRGPGAGYGPGGFGGRGGPGHRFGPRHRPSLEEIQKRNADRFAQMDVNHDGRVTFEEFRQFVERRRAERQREMFRRFSGGADSFTLDQLNARAAERLADHGRRGPDGRSAGRG